MADEAREATSSQNVLEQAYPKTPLRVSKRSLSKGKLKRRLNAFLPEPSETHLPEKKFAEHVTRIVMNDVQCYEELLLRHSAISLCHPSYLTFVVPDFNPKKKSLKSSQYVIVRRKAVAFRDTDQWVYSCSCKEASVEFMRTLNSHCDTDLNEDAVNSIWPSCVHGQAVAALLERFDAQNGTTAADYLQINTLSCNDAQMVPIQLGVHVFMERQ